MIYSQSKGSSFSTIITEASFSSPTFDFVWGPPSDEDCDAMEVGDMIDGLDNLVFQPFEGTANVTFIKKETTQIRANDLMSSQ